MDLNINKNNLGKLLFIISGLVLLVMIFTPLNNYIIHKDEYFTLRMINFSVTEVITMTANDVHPPLYYIILKVVTKIFSALHVPISTIFVLKLVSVIPYGIIFIFSGIKLREEYGWLTVGIFTFALACASQFFYFFILARMYSLGLLLLFFSFYYFKNIIQKSDRKSWILFTIFTVLGAYTQYFVAMSSLVLYLMLLIFIIRNPESRISEIKKWICSVVASVILYLPWMLVFLKQVSGVHESFWVSPLTFDYFIKCLNIWATSNDLIYLSIFSIFALIFFIVLLVRNYSDLQENKENFIILSGICTFIGTLLLSSIISVTFKPILVFRYLIPSATVLWFVIAVLIGKIKNNKILIVSLILVILLCISGINDTIYSNDNLMDKAMKYQNTISHIDDKVDIIIFDNGFGFLFMNSLPNVDKYVINGTELLGVPDNRLHEEYDYKSINESQAAEIIKDNPNKRIYISTRDNVNDFGFNLTQKAKVFNTYVFYEVNRDYN